MKLEEMIQLQVLKLKASTSLHGRLADQVVEESEGKVKLKQMCAKVSPQLYDELENVCSFLDLSKREFIEAAVSEAIDKANEHIRALGEEFRQGQGQLGDK